MCSLQTGHSFVIEHGEVLELSPTVAFSALLYRTRSGILQVFVIRSVLCVDTLMDQIVWAKSHALAVIVEPLTAPCTPRQRVS